MVSGLGEKMSILQFMSNLTAGLNILHINISLNILPTNTNITSSWQSLALTLNDLKNKSNFHWELFIWNKMELCAANKLAVDYGTHL